MTARERSFNPSVGILGVQASNSLRCPGSKILRFNPSVGILGVQAGWCTYGKPGASWFQSLGRDSGCSSGPTGTRESVTADSFNPSVGILGVQAFGRRFVLAALRFVSIPRSGFWVFKPAGTPAKPAGCSWFQSLGRDSGCSSFRVRRMSGSVVCVSIPRSGFWVFKPLSCALSSNSTTSFNPSVGILGVQAGTSPRQTTPTASFNPSVGILSVQA